MKNSVNNGAPVLPLLTEGLSFHAGGNRLIDAMSFRLEAGPRTIILGPNGAGKSLLLRLCHGLLEPSGGTVNWNGMPRAEWPRAQAMVFQRPVMLRRSVAANVDYALAIRGVPKADRRSRVEEALAKTGLADFARRPARVLSFGEQQKLALARAWALRPQVLFLDEPTASLDPAATRAVEDIIGAIHAAGTKIVMTTHDLGQAKRIGDEILFLHKGQLIERSPADVFFQSPETELARAFLEGELLW
ncbi:MAG: ATP-binding cassette domain-containing protein [Rhodospirillales bacterium]|nr:ATP-binding cassette domain-containing protein [Rhodospirillales bacterium]